MDRIAFKTMLENVVGENIEAFPAYVPEGQPLPGIAYDHIVGVKHGRDLEAKPAGGSDTWRVSVVAENRADCDRITNKLELLDASNNANFMLVLVLNITDNPVGELDNFYTTLIDIQTYNR